MFSLREFVKKGLISAIGVQSDYWVILEAAKWFDKGVLLEEDLIEINALINEKNMPVETVVEETEEVENEELNTEN